MKSVQMFSKILLYQGFVDFRKWANGLAMIVEHEIKEQLVDPNALFVFVSKNRKSIKCLYWNHTGLALWTTTLEKEKFRVKHKPDGKVLISSQQMQWILDGIDWEKISPHTPIFPKKYS